MSASINFHGPYEFSAHHYPADTVPNHPDPYSSLGIEDGKDSDVTLYFDGRAGLDSLIKAALALRDQWPSPGPLPPATHCPVCGGKLDGNGEHVTRNGVSIPAQAETVLAELRRSAV